MRGRRTGPGGWNAGRIGAGMALILCAGVAAVLVVMLGQSGSGRNPIITAPVRRMAALTASVNAPGRVASSNSTEIRCQLERVSSGSSSTDGASTILYLIPEGSAARKGDLLCELDSSEFAELVRRQEIGVQKAQAEHLQAELDVAIAELNLKSYLEGTQQQTEQQYKGQLALTEADLSRQTDRMAWSQRMLDKGYSSLSQFTGEELNLRKLRMSLGLIETEYKNYQRFSIPKETRALESQVIGARATLSFQTTRLKLEEDRLALFKRQVEHCTIRAPHDGMVIYANRPGDSTPRIFEGASVRQRQPILTLPDMSQMEIEILIHETVVDRVAVGMPARVRIEALPGVEVLGRLTSIGRLPVVDRGDRNSSGEVKYYMAHIDLDQIPRGLMPGMSAEAEIATARRGNILAVPSSAVTIRESQEVCFVRHVDKDKRESFDRRPVTIGQRTPEWLEVVDGLKEGELVAVDPAQVSPPPIPSVRGHLLDKPADKSMFVTPPPSSSSWSPAAKGKAKGKFQGKGKGKGSGRGRGGRGRGAGSAPGGPPGPGPSDLGSGPFPNGR